MGPPCGTWSMFCTCVRRLPFRDLVPMLASRGAFPIAGRSRYPPRTWSLTPGRGSRGRWPDIWDAAGAWCRLLVACFLTAWPFLPPFLRLDGSGCHNGFCTRWEYFTIRIFVTAELLHPEPDLTIPGQVTWNGHLAYLLLLDYE